MNRPNPANSAKPAARTRAAIAVLGRGRTLLLSLLGSLLLCPHKGADLVPVTTD